MKFYKGERVVFTGSYGGFTINHTYIVSDIKIIPTGENYDYIEMSISDDSGRIHHFSVNPYPENETFEDKMKHVSFRSFYSII